MAIQNRRGNYADFDKAKMVAGEIAVVQSGDPNSTDGSAVYVAPRAGSAKRLSTHEDMTNEIASATSEIAQQLVTEFEQDIADDLAAAQQAASAASASATSAAQSAQGIAESAEQIDANTQDIIDLEKDLNGTVPNAAQLISDNYTIDQTPYLYRQTNSNGADRAIEEIVGGSVVWNQLCTYLNSTVTFRGITYSVQNGVVTCNGTATEEFVLTSTNTFSEKNNHVLYVAGCPNGGSSTTYYVREGYDANNTHWDVGTGRLYKKNTGNSNLVCQIIIKNGYSVNNLVFKPQIYDLTQMFGTTIADYIYNLEQSSAGAGVAFFRKLFPEDYYAYDAGTMQHVSGVSAKETVGKNLLNMTASSSVSNGVSFNVNKDGSISLSGTASANTYFYFGDTQLSDIKNGNYILSGCPSGGSYSKYGIQINHNGAWLFDYGSGVSIQKTGAFSSIGIRIASGTNVNGLVFKPMLRLASVSGPASP